MINTQDDKTYFQPGNIVTLKQDIPNVPKMIVTRIERSIFRKNNEQSILKGCKCRWFTKDGLLQEATFNTKDLILIK